MALILDLALQDTGAGYTWTDASASANHGTSAVLAPDDVAVGGPGGVLTRAVDGKLVEDFGDAIALGSEISFAASDEFHLSFFGKRNDTTQFDIFSYDSLVISLVYFTSSSHSIRLADQSSGGGQRATGVDTTAWHHYGFNGQADGTVDVWVDGSLSGPLASSRVDVFAMEYIKCLSNGYGCGMRVYDTVLAEADIISDAARGGISPAAGGGQKSKWNKLRLIGAI